MLTFKAAGCALFTTFSEVGQSLTLVPRKTKSLDSEEDERNSRQAATFE